MGKELVSAILVYSFAFLIIFLGILFILMLPIVQWKIKHELKNTSLIKRFEKFNRWFIK